MSLSNGEALLRAILGMTARQTFSVIRLAEIVLARGPGKKQLAAFNMCDGTKTQAEIVKALKLDKGAFSRTLARWIDAGVVIRLGEARDSKPLHIYPLPGDAAKLKDREK